MAKLKVFYFIFSLLVYESVCAQHTFSIVAVDSVTGQIGSAGATCGDSVIWPGSPGALIISDIIPGVGAINTQAQYDDFNQFNAHMQMINGKSPEEIVAWMVMNDWWVDSTIRQYGVVDYNNGHPRSAAFTGSNCMDWKGQIIGPGYSIQGNILSGPEILDSMQSRFLNTRGSLADRLLAALQGAKVIGADSRCAPNGVSSLSAFMRVAKPNDDSGNFYLDLNVPATPDGVDPIDALKAKYKEWWLASGIEGNGIPNDNIEIFPNPAKNYFTIDYEGKKADRIVIYNILGKSIFEQNIISKQTNIDIDFDKGCYIICHYFKNYVQQSKILVTK